MVTYLIIGALVLWSAIYSFKKIFPQSAFKVFSALARGCEQRGWMTLAKWLRPAIAAGCSGGCGCSADTSSQPKKVTVQAVKWK
ncbi:DUF6587 family protein [Acinetobacter sp. MB5]|uniref:DUF6587 family protein n=1 Tax=Acinetobacter sp. MB5 TaxID=2069438 RepID=UPI000DCFE4F0|nr:DUF6587 family protein [Acinetobacter sp. MB5]